MIREDVLDKKVTDVFAGKVVRKDLVRKVKVEIRHQYDEEARGRRSPFWIEQIPLENKRNFLEVSGEIMETVDPIFFSDPQTAAIKALALK